jgi:hypothetical protein
MPPLILSSHPFAFGCVLLGPWAVFGFLDCLEVDADHALSRGRGLIEEGGPDCWLVIETEINHVLGIDPGPS